MKPLIKLIIILLTPLLYFYCSEPYAPFAPKKDTNVDTIRISGSLFIGNSKAKSVRITLSGPSFFLANSDSNGFFKIDSMKPGTYEMQCMWYGDNKSSSHYLVSKDITMSCHYDSICLLKPPLLKFPNLITRDYIDISCQIEKRYAGVQVDLYQMSSNLPPNNKGIILANKQANGDTIIVFNNILDSTGYYYRVYIANDSGYHAWSNFISSQALSLQLNNEYEVFHRWHDAPGSYVYWKTENTIESNYKTYTQYQGTYLRSTTSEIYRYIDGKEEKYMDLFCSIGDTITNNWIVKSIDDNVVLGTKRRSITLVRLDGDSQKTFCQTFGWTSTNSRNWENDWYYTTYSTHLMGAIILENNFGSYNNSK